MEQCKQIEHDTIALFAHISIPGIPGECPKCGRILNNAYERKADGTIGLKNAPVRITTLTSQESESLLTALICKKCGLPHKNECGNL
jgi:hypothetical protein